MPQLRETAMPHVKWLGVFAGAALAAGCVTIAPVPQTLGHPSGWSDETRATATETYSYALLSAAAYPETSLALGPSLRQIGGEPKGSCGFSYKVFERLEGNRPVEVVIAFEGTTFADLGDWVCGNILGRHNRWGSIVYREWRDRTPGPIPVNVTGHSLGGGIATHISLNYPAVNSYAFNSSPRFWLLGVQEKNRRISVVEHGEILKLTRLFGREADQLYMSIGCSSGDPFGQHAMIKLAACLTHIAAIGCQGARSIAEKNPGLWRNDVPWRRMKEDEAGRRCIRLPVIGTDAHPLELIEKPLRL